MVRWNAVSKQATWGTPVLGAKGLVQERVLLQVDLRDRQVVGRVPVLDDGVELLVGEGRRRGVELGHGALRARGAGSSAAAASRRGAAPRAGRRPACRGRSPPA